MTQPTHQIPDEQIPESLPQAVVGDPIAGLGADEEDLITVNEAAKLIGRSWSTVETWARKSYIQLFTTQSGIAEIDDSQRRVSRQQVINLNLRISKFFPVKK